mgnify:CR=1 FL=1
MPFPPIVIWLIGMTFAAVAAIAIASYVRTRKAHAEGKTVPKGRMKPGEKMHRNDTIAVDPKEVHEAG